MILAMNAYNGADTSIEGDRELSQLPEEIKQGIYRLTEVVLLRLAHQIRRTGSLGEAVFLGCKELREIFHVDRGEILRASPHCGNLSLNALDSLSGQIQFLSYPAAVRAELYRRTEEAIAANVEDAQFPHRLFSEYHGGSSAFKYGIIQQFLRDAGVDSFLAICGLEEGLRNIARPLAMQPLELRERMCVLAARYGYVSELEGLIDGAGEKSLAHSLCFATFFGHTSCVRFLVKRVAPDVTTSVECKAGWAECPPLWFALERGREACMKVLIGAGADVHAVPFGRTLLMTAAYSGKASCVRLLLDAGARKEDRDAEGLTPLDYARRSGAEWEKLDELIALLS